MLKEKILQDIEYNIKEIIDRINNTQKFNINIIIYNIKDDCLEDKEVQFREFVQEQNNLSGHGLWSIVAQNYLNFIINYQQSLQNFDNSMDHLILEIDKISLALEKYYQDQANTKDRADKQEKDFIKKSVKNIQETKSDKNKLRRIHFVGTDSSPDTPIKIRKFSEVYSENKKPLEEDEPEPIESIEEDIENVSDKELTEEEKEFLEIE